MVTISANRRRYRTESPRYSGKRNCGSIFLGKGSTGVKKLRIGLRVGRQNDTELQPIGRRSDTQAAAFDLFARRAKKPPPFMGAAITVTGPAASAFMRRTSRALSGVM